MSAPRKHGIEELKDNHAHPIHDPTYHNQEVES